MISKGMTIRTISQRISNVLFLAIMLSFLVSSCTDEVSYNKSADVHHEGWAPADTLLFDFNVVDTIPLGRLNILERNRSYQLSLSFRYSDEYRYKTLPIHILIDGRKSFVVKQELSRRPTWGSLMQDEFLVKGIPVSFADTGRHVLSLYPDTTLVGIYSVGIDLQK